MARRRNQKDTSSAASIPLTQPDRSGPDPSRETLLDIAEKRGLLDDERQPAAEEDEADSGKDEEIVFGRAFEALLWSISLTMVHFTLDVLVYHQYAVALKWPVVISRSLQAFPVIFFLIYTLHPHPIPSVILPQSNFYPEVLGQIFFFAGSIAAGCYLIYISNVHGYLAIMKRAPPVGCMWIWSVVELNLPWAVGSLACCGAFLWWNGYGYL